MKAGNPFLSLPTERQYPEILNRQEKNGQNSRNIILGRQDERE
jgi:hypothetical protein